MAFWTEFRVFCVRFTNLYIDTLILLAGVVYFLTVPKVVTDFLVKCIENQFLKV